MAGSTFASRDFSGNIGDILNTPLQSAEFAREARALSPWGQYTVDVNPTPDGLITANDALAKTGIVKNVNINSQAGTRQATWVFAKEVSGEPTFGQNVSPLGDSNQFLYDDVKIGQIRSPNFALPSQYQQRDGWNAVKAMGGWDAVVRRNVSLWAGTQHGVDHIEALLRGASPVVLSSASGALNDNIGGVNAGDTPSSSAFQAGSQRLHEIIVMPDASGNTVLLQPTAYTAAAQATYETSVATALKALQAAAFATQQCVGVDTFRQLRFLAAKYNIRPLKGANYDYVFYCDWEIAEGLIGTVTGTQGDTLKAIWKTMSALMGQGQDVLAKTAQKDLVFDGIKIVPDRTLAGWRPVDITGVSSPTGANVVFGGTTTLQSGYTTAKQEAYKTNAGVIGHAFLLGDSALISSTDGGIDVLPLQGDQDSGMSYCSREWRSVRRCSWKGRDPVTAGTFLQVGSIHLMFRIPANGATIY